jgi:hypothetical protein
MSDDELIDAHWEYVRGICEKMYKDAFRHGLKHGREEKKEDLR